MNLDFEFQLFSRKIKLDAFDISFIFVLLGLVFINMNFISTLKQIPSPLYGGDFYNGLGGVIHILDGGNLFSSAQMVSEHPWVPWGYHLFVSIFSRITGFDAIHSLLYFSIPVQILSFLAIYLILSRWGGNKFIALAGVFLISAYFPVFKYSDFSSYLVIPAFILSILYFLEKQSTFSSLLAGVFLAFCSLSNTQAFFVSNLLLLVIFGLKFYSLGYVKMSSLSDKSVHDLAKNFAIVFIIGFSFSMLFWFNPLFVFKGVTPNDIQNITTPDITVSSVLWKGIFDLLFNLFLPYGISIPFILLSLVCITGIYVAIKNFKSDTFALIISALLLTQLVNIFHPLITLPLFNNHLVNFMMFDRLNIVFQILVLSLGSSIILGKLSGIVKHVFLFAILAFSGYTAFTHISALESDVWIKVGKESLAPPYVDLSNWVRSYTNVNDAFITTNEGGFMLNALTGRKVVSYRRSHSSPYTNVNDRMLDQAVIVYGSDDAKRVELLKKYGVKYVLWSNRWLFDEYNFDNSGRVIGFFDPLNVPDNVTNRYYWSKEGVSYIEAKMPLDPAPRPDAPFYNMLISVPKSPTLDVPFSPSLLDHFKLVKTISYEGQDFFRIYEFTG